jgi:hypothetical protein
VGGDDGEASGVGDDSVEGNGAVIRGDVVKEFEADAFVDEGAGGGFGGGSSEQVAGVMRVVTSRG